MKFESNKEYMGNLSLHLIGWNLFASDVPLEPRAKLGEWRTNEIRFNQWKIPAILLFYKKVNSAS